MESIAVIASYIQRAIHLIFYTFISYNVYTLLLRPIFNTLYPIYHYRRFHSLPKKFLLGNIQSILPNFPFTSPFKDICLNANIVADTIVNTNKDRSISVFWLGPFPLVFVSHHEVVEVVMTKSNLEKPFLYKFIGLRNGLFTSDVALWKIRRRVVEPFYVTKRQRRYVEIMDEEISSFPKLLAQWIGKPVDIEHLINSSSLNIICKISASIPLKDLPETKENIIEIIKNLELIALGKEYFQQIDRLDPLIDSVTSRRQEVTTSFPSINEDHDLLHLLEPCVNREGLIEELMITIIAGHETVSVALRWTLFILGNHPDIQERVHHEILDYFPGDEPVNDLDKLNQCTYLERCLKESLRLYPPIPAISRVLSEDVMVKGTKLLKNSWVLIDIKDVHRDPRVYPNPTKYDPERWNLKNRTHDVPKTAFIPFAYGPRNCIGHRYAMTIMKIYLVHIVRKFSWKSTRKEAEIPIRWELTCVPDLPLEIIITARNNNHESNI